MVQGLVQAEYGRDCCMEMQVVSQNSRRGQPRRDERTVQIALQFVAEQP